MATLQNIILKTDARNHPPPQENPLPLTELPEELWLQIFSELESPRDIANASLACKKFHTICADPYLWKSLYGKSHFQKCNASSCPILTKRSYPALCRDHMTFERNVRSGKWTSFHFAFADTLLFQTELHGNLLFMRAMKQSEGQERPYLRIWDLATGKCLSEFPGDPLVHQEKSSTNSPLFLIFRDSFSIIDPKTAAESQTFKISDLDQDIAFQIAAADRLYRILEDGTIKVWDLKSGNCLQTFQGDDDWRTCEAFYCEGQYLYVTPMSEEGENYTGIKVLNVKTGEFQNIESESGIFLCQIVKDYVLFLDSQGMNIWDLNEKKCIQSIPIEDSDDVQDLKRIGDCLCIRLPDQQILLWDIQNIPEVRKLNLIEEFQDQVAQLSLIGNQVYMILQDNTIKILNLSTKQCLTLNTTREKISPIEQIHPEKNHLAVYSTQNQISIWCLETEKCLYQFTPRGIGFTTLSKCQHIGMQGQFLFLQTELYPRIDVIDVTTGNVICFLKTEDLNFVLKRCFSNDRLVSVSRQDEESRMTIWDFGSAFEANLAMLKTLASGELSRRGDSTFHLHHEIAFLLINHPLHFSDFPQAARSIAVKICLETFYIAIQDQNLELAQRMHTELASISLENAHRLYELLWIECGKPNVLGQLDSHILTRDEISDAVAELQKDKDAMALDDPGTELEGVELATDTHQTDLVLWGQSAFSSLDPSNETISPQHKLNAIYKLIKQNNS